MEFIIENGILLECREPFMVSVVTVPDEVTAIGAYAFRKCDKLRRVYFPSHITSIGEKAFANHYKLIEVRPKDARSISGVILPEGLTSIGESAFKNCPILTTVTLPSTIRHIGRYAFSGCTSIAELTLPDTVEFGESVLSGQMARYGQWKELRLHILRQDGRRFTLPIHRDDHSGISIPNAILEFLVHRRFDADVPLPAGSRLIFEMLKAGYLTEECLHANREIIFRIVIESRNTDALELLIDAGLPLPEIPAKEYEELIVCANQKQNYQLQLFLMEHMQKYCRTETSALPEQFRL